MRAVDIIEKKRNGFELDEKEIKFLINGFMQGDIPDYQLSAFLMAVYFKGLNEREQADLTMAMVNSGDKIDLSMIDGIKVDKHSTGGVGDTTTLVLAPLVASVGVPVAKMSGRGLGHTGGTIDKLEAIPGFNVEIENENFLKLVKENNLALVSQSGNLTPADKKMYALRDVTGTVESLGLIASSVMSKKIASGADAIVLDVKTGEGAFMKTLEDSEKLAQAMVKIGSLVGRETMAVITDMNQPLGFAVGNSLEVIEAIETLKGEGPDDLTELSLKLGSYMVYLAGKAQTTEEAEELLRNSIASGKAIEMFEKFVASQGGDVNVIKDTSLLPSAKYKIPLVTKEDGYIEKITANEIGHTAMLLGAGRMKKEDEIDLSAGIVLNKKIGDFVSKGEILLTIHSNSEDIEGIKNKLYESIKINKNKVEKGILIYKEVKNHN